MSRVASSLPLLDTISRTEALTSAAWIFSLALNRDVALDQKLVRTTMEDVYRASDADGAWDWKDAYEAAELAQVLYIRRHAAFVSSNPRDEVLAALSTVQALTPSQTRRSETQVEFQQFSTPIDLAYVASLALDPRPTDVLLEPSAGTGLLAVFAEIVGARVHLNELDNGRAELLSALFRDTPVTRLNAEQINDRLPAAVRPSLVLMNPPFSVSPDVKGGSRGADFRHIASALARLTNGGRLVAITGAGLSPEQHPGRFQDLQRTGATLQHSVAIDGRVFGRHGTTTETRLLVIDKIAAADPTVLTPSLEQASDVASLMASLKYLPQRSDIAPARELPVLQTRPSVVSPRTISRPRTTTSPVSTSFSDVIELEYCLKDPGGDRASSMDGIYEAYAVESVEIAGAQAHPTPLVQSLAMAAVRLPAVSYRPFLPKSLVEKGILSEAQLETIIYAGAAHDRHLAGHWAADETFDTIRQVKADEGASYRQGFFLGDGTGAGKGRQLAGVALDNWLQGRRRIIWVSKNEALLEDARRDWTALGGHASQVVPISRFSPKDAIQLQEGILFVTYGALRNGSRAGEQTRLQQIVNWLGADFDGLIAFDEAHAMANAAGEKGARGDRGPSEQGRAGLRLQNALPNARILYVSATGATTVANLGYASRLGLWGGSDFPFPTRASFVAAMEAGGVAAMEVLARDLKALGLYTARALSYTGVEYEMLEHELSPEQVEIYNAYADAFAIIYNNLEDALRASGICDEDGATQNRHAKAAARSAFHSASQRFFNALLTSMKTPSIITAIEQGLQAGQAPVIQLVSTGEAIMERRLADIPVSEWHDLQVDMTPREYVHDYLLNSFPVTLFEPFTDEEGNLLSRPALDDQGHPILCQIALEARQNMIEHLGALPPVHSCLDQIIHHFGHDQVAEVTGRTRRIIKRVTPQGIRMSVQSRPTSSNRQETQAFMDGVKPILIFSDAGGTGRSYHADLGCKTSDRRRLHLLAEAGWQASAAVQGLGRTNRTNQKSPPLFRPVATNVKGEKRFLSTIARRLDSLGALTKGQRQTGGQGLFRPQDNLESDYAKTALRRLFVMLHMGKVEGLSITEFEDATGLSLRDSDGTLKESLPPITQTLNRLLALRIETQDRLFAYLEERIEAEIDAAVSAGTFEVGVETLQAESFVVTETRNLFTHGASGAQTQMVSIRQKQRPRIMSLDDVTAMVDQVKDARPVVNTRSGKPALVTPAASSMDDAGNIERRVSLSRPTERRNMSEAAFSQGNWKPVDWPQFYAAWADEISGLPEFEESTVHIVTGLLLPIWSRLPDDSTRVYRLTTDDGDRIIGRVIEPDQVPSVCNAFGLSAPSIDPAMATNLVLEGGATLHLNGGLSLRRRMVMNAWRVELCDYPFSALSAFKAMGLQTEIISFKTRLFVPLGDDLTGRIRQILAKHPIMSVQARERLAA